jgi:hypothetical protein
MEALELLTRAGEKIKRGQEYFKDLAFAARYIMTITGRAERLDVCRKILHMARVLEERGATTQARHAARVVRTALRDELRTARHLQSEAKRRWAKSRFADDPKRDGIAPEVSLGFDALTQQLRYAVETLDKLVADPTLLG